MALFFIISPLVIMYTAGYRYDIASRTILETGVISIDIEPRDAQVVLNTIPIQKQIPIRLTNRAPGRYTVSFSRDGYHPFEHMILVESKQTTYLRDITLFKNSLPILIPTPDILLENSSTIYAHPTLPQYLAHTATEGVHEIGLLTYRNDVPEYVALMRTVADTLVTLAWSPYSNYSVLQLRMENDGIHTYAIDVQNRRVSDPIITTVIPTYHFAEQDATALYVQNEAGLWGVIPKRSGVDIALNRIPTHELPDRWYIQHSTQHFIHPQTSSTLSFSIPIDRIVHIRNNTILATQGSMLHRFEKQDAQVTLVESYDEASIITQGQYLLISTPWSITRINADGGSELLLRTSNRISQITILGPRRPELLITNSSGIEIFDPRYNMSTPLIQNSNIQQVTFEGGRQPRIYFSTTIGRQEGIFRLDI
jgi:hypothetical protein